MNDVKCRRTHQLPRTRSAQRTNFEKADQVRGLVREAEDNLAFSKRRMIALSPRSVAQTQERGERWMDVTALDAREMATPRAGSPCKFFLADAASRAQVPNGQTHAIG